MTLEELSNQLDLMDQLVVRETPVQRQVWKRKILELREESQSIHRQGEHYDRLVNANVRQQRERNELLSRRRKGGQHNQTSWEEQHLNNLADESSSLRNSHAMVGDLLATGEASLTGLVEQRQRLRGVRRAIFDIGNRLGLSNATMRIIERRDITDAYLVLVGIIVTCITIYVVWFVL